MSIPRQWSRALRKRAERAMRSWFWANRVNDHYAVAMVGDYVRNRRTSLAFWPVPASGSDWRKRRGCACGLTQRPGATTWTAMSVGLILFGL